ncbi:MAG: ABC transporter permease [Chitinispirillaceae bacterium]|nr:ABC transporter permease [Chitinispirillaceae bacterium]
MSVVENMVAMRYLRGKRKIGTYVTALGIFIGSFVLIIALSIANGFEKEVRDRVVGTLAHAKILQYHSIPVENYDSLRREILKHPKVKAASPYINGKAGLEHDQTQEGVMVIGVDDSLEAAVTDINKKVVWGTFSLDSVMSERGRTFPGICIGMGLANKIGVSTGAEVVLLCLAKVEGEMDPVPKMARFTVSGVFETGMYEYDLSLVYVSIESAQNLFNMKGVEGIQIKTSNLFEADKIAADVRDFLGGYPYREVDWQTQNRSLFQWMKLEKLIIFIVISMIMFVAALNIISSLITIVFEKRREIGILMSMGATSRTIMSIFMKYGVMVGFVGSTAGVLLGVVLCYIQYTWRLIPLPGDIYFIDTVPILLNPLDVFGVYIAANVIAWLTTVYPAWKASKMLPAESIRFE